MIKKINLNAGKYLRYSVDSLGFFSIILHIYYAIHWSNFYYTGNNHFITFFYIPQLLLMLPLIGVLLPKSTQLLLVNSVLFIAHFIYQMPTGSNNQTTAFFLSILVAISICLSCLNYKSASSTRENIVQLIRGPGKLILVTMYFYGIYHKLNIDFLNPAVSCAVALYKPIASIVGQENNQFGHWIAIYLTFVIEGLAIVGLLIKRYQKIGLAAGIPFHILIGFTGYAFYMDFSTIVLAMYALNMNDQSLQCLKALYRDNIRSKYIKSTILFLPILFVLIMYIYVVLICDGVCSNISFMPIFALYSIPVYLMLLCSVASKEAAFVKQRFLYLIPVLFFLKA